MRRLFWAIVHWLRVLRTSWVLKDFYWGKKLAGSMVIDLNDVEVRKPSGELFLKKLGIAIEKNSNKEFLIGPWAYRHLTNSLKHPGKFCLKNGELYFEVDNISVRVKDGIDMGCIGVVFFRHDYSLKPLGHSVILDIGMNVGMASLYFASLPEVEAVYSYEPDKDTYKSALENFHLNPELSHKIHHFNTGIGDSNRIIEFYKDINDHSSSSIYPIYDTPLGDELGKKKNQVSVHQVELKDASQIVSEIANRHPNLQIIAKIDCEGAEYEIIESLSKSGMLTKLNAILMEWHIMNNVHDPNDLLDALTNSGFKSFYSACNNALGMIYALHTNDQT